jgi:hypothetical protein
MRDVAFLVRLPEGGDRNPKVPASYRRNWSHIPRGLQHSWACERQECDRDHQDHHGEEAQFHWRELLGQRIFRLDGWSG